MYYLKCIAKLKIYTYIQELWTSLCLLDWTLHLLVISPTRHFVYSTLHLRDISPTGQFAYYLDISPTRPNLGRNFDNSEKTAVSYKK